MFASNTILAILYIDSDYDPEIFLLAIITINTGTLNKVYELLPTSGAVDNIGDRIKRIRFA